MTEEKGQSGSQKTLTEFCQEIRSGGKTQFPPEGKALTVDGTSTPTQQKGRQWQSGRRRDCLAETGDPGGDLQKPNAETFSLWVARKDVGAGQKPCDHRKQDHIGTDIQG